ncbi:MAG TPA: type II toxin-antitoxin system VapC family toxin [Thermodesulfobacteriota bacterium]|nr:type II toxin-antitoxin system VapC family toxin [Thermodesulfobacteriota bacterium]
MFPEYIFVDTGAWVALADKDDAHHKDAISAFPTLLKTSRALLTSNLVVAETYILLLNELGHPAALSFLERLKASPRIKKACSAEDIEEEAEGILRKCGDQDFSYTDAVSFVIMRRQKIKKAFCFDKHFETANFVVIP